MKALKPVTVATKLAIIEARLEKLAELREAYRKQLFDVLKHQGVKSVKLDNGSMYLRSERHTLKPVDKEAAMAWATEHHALKIDAAKAFQILRRELELPSFFKVDKAEYLVVRRANGDDEPEE